MPAKYSKLQKEILDAVVKLLPVRDKLIEHADSLTAQVHAAEALLAELRLGVAIKTPLSGAVPTYLAHRKVAGRNKRKVWRLVIEEEGVAECVVLADVNQAMKAEALQALPRLLADGVAQMEEMIEQRKLVVANTKIILDTIRVFNAEQAGQ